MSVKTRLPLVVLLASMSVQMSCVRGLPENRVLQNRQSSEYLRLSAGVPYVADREETWVAVWKYEALERAYISALGALDQERNKSR